MTIKPLHKVSDDGIVFPFTYMTTGRITDARATRQSTIVNGGKSLTATPAKKKEPPYRIDNKTIRTHS
jgi:hypothetical protein